MGLDTSTRIGLWASLVASLLCSPFLYCLLDVYADHGDVESCGVVESCGLKPAV